MKPNRYYRLRHPTGLGDSEIETLATNCSEWRTWVEERLAVYREELGWGDDIQYVFFEPQLSEDRRTATVPLGGEPMYPAVGMFEGDVLFRSMVKGLPRDFLARASVRKEEPENPSPHDAHWLPAYSYMESPGAYLRARGLLADAMLWIAGPPAFRWMWSAFVLLDVGALFWDAVDGLRDGSLPPILRADRLPELLFLLAFGLFSFRAAQLGWRSHRFTRQRQSSGR